jgi:DNA-binding YbaB/EbfC family protein
MFGDMKAKQKEMTDKLARIQVIGSSPEDAVKVTANGAKEIVSIEFNWDKLDLNDKEQLEDFILLATNDALAKAGEEAEILSQQMISEMLPGGLGGLGNLFG